VPATTPPFTAPLNDACDAVFTLDAPAAVGLVQRRDAWSLRDGPFYVVPEDLIGFVAPAEWAGMAVVSTGTAHHLDTGRSLRARVTYALDRTGREASSVTTAEGTTRTDSTDGAPTVGHLADVCHRALGRPAAPEPSAPVDLLAAGWLSDVLSAHHSMGDGFPVDDWDGIVSLCPFDAGSVDRSSWESLHAAMVDLGVGWGDLTADDVAWTDPPTLARFMLAAMPPLSWLVDEVRSVLPPAVIERLVTTITAAGASPLSDRVGQSRP
jgi:hypothetical protein